MPSSDDLQLRLASPTWDLQGQLETPCLLQATFSLSHHSSKADFEQPLAAPCARNSIRWLLPCFSHALDAQILGASKLIQANMLHAPGSHSRCECYQLCSRCSMVLARLMFAGESLYSRCTHIHTLRHTRCEALGRTPVACPQLSMCCCHERNAICCGGAEWL